MTSSYNWSILHQHLQSLALPRLRSFHFSVRDQPLPNIEFDRMMRVSSTSKAGRASFWNYDFSPSIVRCLKTLPSGITVLDVVTDVHNACYPMEFRRNTRNTQCDLLPQYLSDSPSSICLRILRAPFLLEHLDLHHRATLDDDPFYIHQRKRLQRGATFISPISDNTPRIWNCRNLRILKLELHAHHEVALVTAVHSRIIFGFLFRVVSKLQDRQLDMPLCCTSAHFLAYRPQVSMELKGGLCLIARLQYLEKFCIRNNQQSDNDERIDLSWMATSGHDVAASRQERRRIVEKWSEVIALEEEQEIARIEKDLWKSDDAVVWENVDDVLQHDFKYLGLLLDVKHMAESMDADGYTCLEHLQEVSLNNGVERRPIEELNKLFPPGCPLVDTALTG